jgi:hydrogenase nickel incorporation protein HypB
MFRAADLVLLTKADLLPVLDDFDPARAERCLRDLASPVPFMPLSARRADATLSAWLDWLRRELADQRERLARGATARPALRPEGALLHGAHAGHQHGAPAQGHAHAGHHGHRHQHSHGHDGHSHRTG